MIHTQLRVFVASTYTDLKSYRDAVRHCLDGLNLSGINYFGKQPDDPGSECINMVRSCNIYIGIFGMRYGSIREGQKKSMIHLEYEEAQYLRIPSLIYLIDEEKQPVLPIHIELGAGAEKLRQLKTALREKHIVSLFTSEEDLASKIVHDLPRLLQTIGWEQPLDSEGK